MPIFKVLLTTINCSQVKYFVPDTYWLALGFECFAGTHLVIVIISLVLAFAFAIFVGVFTFVFVDSNPLSTGHKGASSGRSALLMLLWKARRGLTPTPHTPSLSSYCAPPSSPSTSTLSSGQVVLIVLTGVVPEYIGRTACSVIVVIAGALWMINILWCVAAPSSSAPNSLHLPPPPPRVIPRRYMPATNHTMNQLQLAFAAIFTFTAVCACIGLGVKTYDAAVRPVPPPPPSLPMHAWQMRADPSIRRRYPCGGDGHIPGKRAP